MDFQSHLSCLKSNFNLAVHCIKETKSVKFALAASITSIAGLAFLNYMLRPQISNPQGKIYMRLSSALEKRVTGDDKLKNTIKSFYSLNNQLLLNTDLQLQKRPTRLQAVWNQFKVALGYQDQFENIKAKNVIPKLIEFVENNKDSLFFTQMNGWYLPNILENFQTRINVRYSAEIRKIKDSLKDVQPTTWKALLEYKESYTSLPTPLLEKIVQAAEEGDNDACILLGKMAKAQAEKIEKNQKFYESYTLRLAPNIFDFQTDFQKNAYIQLSIVFWKNENVEIAKEMIQLAFSKTHITSLSWNKTMDASYFSFFEKTCSELNTNENKKVNIQEASKLPNHF